MKTRLHRIVLVTLTGGVLLICFVLWHGPPPGSQAPQAKSANQGAPEAPVLIDTRSELWAQAAAEAISQVGTAAIPSLVTLVTQRMKDSWTGTQLACAGFGGLGERGAPAIPTLITFLDDPSQEVRSVAAECLKFIGPPATNAAPKLIQMLTNDDKEVRLSALGALFTIPAPPETVVPAVVKLLETSHTEGANGEWEIWEKTSAIAILRFRLLENAALALPILRQMTNDPSSVVREDAGALLKDIETPEKPRPLPRYDDWLYRGARGSTAFTRGHGED